MLHGARCKGQVWQLVTNVIALDVFSRHEHFSDQHSIFSSSSEQLKQRFSFLQLKYGDLYSVLDAAKVCIPFTSLILFKIAFN